MQLDRNFYKTWIVERFLDFLEFVLFCTEFFIFYIFYIFTQNLNNLYTASLILFKIIFEFKVFIISNGLFSTSNG